MKINKKVFSAVVMGVILTLSPAVFSQVIKGGTSFVPAKELAYALDMGYEYDKDGKLIRFTNKVDVND